MKTVLNFEWFQIFYLLKLTKLQVQCFEVRRSDYYSGSIMLDNYCVRIDSVMAKKDATCD